MGCTRKTGNYVANYENIGRILKAKNTFQNFLALIKVRYSYVSKLQETREFFFCHMHCKCACLLDTLAITFCINHFTFIVTQMLMSVKVIHVLQMPDATITPEVIRVPVRLAILEMAIITAQVRSIIR